MFSSINDNVSIFLYRKNLQIEPSSKICISFTKYYISDFSKWFRSRTFHICIYWMPPPPKIILIHFWFINVSYLISIWFYVCWNCFQLIKSDGNYQCIVVSFVSFVGMKKRSMRRCQLIIWSIHKSQTHGLRRVKRVEDVF